MGWKGKVYENDSSYYTTIVKDNLFLEKVRGRWFQPLT